MKKLVQPKGPVMVRQAFTLIEMVIVLFIISLLILIVVPNLSNQRNHARIIHANALTSVIQSQIDSYFSDNQGEKLVTFDKLTQKGYLTDKQVDQAKSEGIKIVKDHAVR